MPRQTPQIYLPKSTIPPQFLFQLIVQEPSNLLYYPQSQHTSITLTRHKASTEAETRESSLCCVKSNPYLFFNVTRCLEYLSSGENLAGCADFVTSPVTTFFSV